LILAIKKSISKIKFYRRVKLKMQLKSLA